ncbi:PilT protein domain protein [Calothrix sp. NIES-4071]|nr:PilT protein domain protein [Calothrix sp. NIES-4071]BAZ64071.1 PilT protein domain protein [Calothrix sp. NIES-4105]
MYLLDTDTLTRLQARNINVIARLKAVEDSEVAITIINKVEILRARIDYLLKAETGADWLKAQELLFRTEEFLQGLIIVPVNQAASLEFERLRVVSNLRKIGRADLLIASITLANRATLVTRNTRHFQQVPGLKIVNWVD